MSGAPAACFARPPPRPLPWPGQEEASPSPVYGARLLSGFGASTPSRVQIPPPPRHGRGSGVDAGAPSRVEESGGLLRTDSPVPRRVAGIGVLAVVVVGAARLAARGGSATSTAAGS